jgi:hypothetical protein
MDNVQQLSCLSFACSALRAPCSDCDFMEHPVLLLQARHMILPSVVKKSSIFTHKINFDGREDAAGAITVLTTQTST